ncbi:hypothetical protein TeGR_g15153 [Tetraparma gracilis]|uniref:TCTP domain-containing protein n=1 Tax=Tetraparma gracilis TaxID=2962635 RepID=A0ABQ6N9X9_9STRA|nr:hypothetical protein TeGR_g15153 [Tetraparma gracilis]
MLIYTCRVTGDEMISDAYDLNPVKDAEGNEVPELFECESMSVNKDSGASVDVGGGNAFGGGGADEEVDDTSENVNNVIDESLGFGYNEVPMGKKDLKDFLKTYCGAVRTMLKDDDKVDGPTVKAFTQAAPTFCKWFLSKADDLQFFMSPSFNPDGAMAFGYYKDGNSTPTFVYIKQGLIEMKV